MELTTKIINSFICLSASAAIGAGGMYLYHKDKINSAGESKLIKECEELLERNGMEFPAGVSKDEASLKGFLAAYNDPYTIYVPAKTDVEQYLNSVNSVSCLVTCGYKVGLGNDGTLTVTNVTAGSIAEQQGLKVGDVILQVDDITVAGDGIEKTALELSGKDGTVMHLVLLCDGARTELDFKRSNDENLGEKPVNAKLIDKVLYLQFPLFDNYTPAYLGGVLNEYEGKYDKLIFDLRDNPGGYTDGAVGCADFFIGNGFVTDYYNYGEVQNHTTVASDNDIKLPTVVLINDKTMSSGEIFTALMKQYGENVTLVGMNTFGKGIFQREAELSNGGTLHYTAGYYTVGNWECYQGKGIAPDVELDMDRSLIGTDGDIQLQKALKLLA
ncbi:MAG: PDZ domain-containing protein [Ruminococcus sp.]|nr:PDZ domain-containing protein [Ruminococcus sp.]